MISPSHRSLSLVWIAAALLALGAGLALTSQRIARVEPAPHDFDGSTPNASPASEPFDRGENGLAPSSVSTAERSPVDVEAAEPTRAMNPNRLEQLWNDAERERAQRIEQHWKTIFLPIASEQAKVEALGALCPSLANNAWSDGVVQEMARVASASADPTVRQDIFRHLGSAHTPSVVTPLLQALAHDGDASVRVEVASALASYKDRPEVRQALENAANNDAAENVRGSCALAIMMPRSVRKLPSMLPR